MEDSAGMVKRQDKYGKKFGLEMISFSVGEGLGVYTMVDSIYSVVFDECACHLDDFAEKESFYEKYWRSWIWRKSGTLALFGSHCSADSLVWWGVVCDGSGLSCFVQTWEKVVLVLVVW